MPIRKIAHIAIAVLDLNKQIDFYKNTLGLEFMGQETLVDQGVKTAFFQVGDTSIELLEPLEKDSAIHKFIEKRGPGLHHIAYEVDDLQASLDDMQSKGVSLVDKSPRTGGHGNQIAFLHPHSTFGVLTEFCKPMGHR